MKLALTLIFIVILAGSIASPQDLPTISFDESLIIMDSPNASFGYDNLPVVRVGLSAELPAKTAYVRLLDGEEVSDISWQVSRRRSIANIDFEKAFEDIPTADLPQAYLEAISIRQQNLLGTAPVSIVRIIQNSDMRWAELMVLPVTINSNGECFVNLSLIISVNGRRLLPAEVESLPEGTAVSYNSVALDPLAPPNPVTSYLIVTSPLLYESAAVLAEYRNSLGIKTEVELIDDILAAYEGRDDAEKLRERLKQFQHDGGQFVLLAGDETQLPIRYAYPYSTSSSPSKENLQICDLYFADLTGEWDADNDGVWGERYTDQIDLTPELIVGRLPFSTAIELTHYTEKLITYETNPGNGNADYIERSFFFSNDQMRDDLTDGQHAAIAEAYPQHFYIDTAFGVELSRGDDPSPYNLSALELIPTLSSGYGIVNVIAHGDHQAFGVRTAGYNEWPKSYFMTADGTDPHGNLNDLEPNSRISFYYSLACDNAAFDKDQPPFNYPQLNLVQCVLGLEDAGAVGFVANTRWGWVSSSYLLQKTFFDSLFAHPERPAACALYDAKATYSFYRDQILGLNYFGDPVLKVYTAKPAPLSLNVDDQGANPVVKVTSAGNPVSACVVTVSQADTILQTGLTDITGSIKITCELEVDAVYTVAAVKSGFTTNLIAYVATVVTDVEDELTTLPSRFNLNQNYPNPFNPSTTIRFELARTSPVRLVIYNVLGQIVTVLKNETMPAGVHHTVWDGTDHSGNNVGSGVYFYKLEAAEFVDTRKMMLLR